MKFYSMIHFDLFLLEIINFIYYTFIVKIQYLINNRIDTSKFLLTKYTN